MSSTVPVLSLKAIVEAVKKERANQAKKMQPIPKPIGSMGRVPVYLPIHECHQNPTIHGSVNIPFVPWILCGFQFVCVDLIFDFGGTDFSILLGHQ